MIDNKHILHPFKELMSWNRNSKLADVHRPIWWDSYNKIKHEKNGLDVATFENALLAIGAVYILINRIYGEGVLIGPLREPISFNKLSLEYIEYKTEESKLFTQATARVDRYF